MPRKFAKKGLKKPKSNGRRKLPSIPLSIAGAGIAAKAIQGGWRRYKAYKVAQAAQQKRDYMKSKRRFDSRVMVADNISTLSACVIGKPRQPSFEERVAKVDRPPLQFKRNYAFSAEGHGGRKTWFSFELNINNGNDLLNDTNVYKQQFYTDTATADATGTSQALGDQSRFYIDYQSEKISITNSSSNSVIGKIHLFAHKRDNDNQLHSTTTPITPINLMAYYSSFALPLNQTSNEATVGNGWKFDTATAGYRYDSVYNMPGSTLNSTGVCLRTDPELSTGSSHIRESMNFWFRKVETVPFSLKPGQQINKSYTFNDLPTIFKEQMDYIHIANVSYSCVVEFIGQTVGDATTTTGDGVVSSGSTQLSCIRQSTRIIGVKTKLRPKICMLTAPLAEITLAQQVIINPDTGISDQGVEMDT